MRRLVAMALMLALTGCQSTPALVAETKEEKDDAKVERGRTQMWTQNCIRCHNARSPGYYSDREWAVAMHHMRLRCSITKEEYEGILSFLQAGN
jgi:hypothetical protein